MNVAVDDALVLSEGLYGYTWSTLTVGGDATLAGALDQGLYHTIAIAGDAKVGGDVNLWGEQAAFSAGGAVELDGYLHLNKGYVKFYAGSLSAAGELYMLYEARARVMTYVSHPENNITPSLSQHT